MVRIKHRYLLLQILYPTAPAASSARTTTKDVISINSPTPDWFTPQMLLRLIRNQLTDLFGDMGGAHGAADLKVNYWNNPTSTAIVRCRRESVRLVWAACMFVRVLRQAMQGGPRNGVIGKSSGATEIECVMRVVHVSGTINKVTEALLARTRAQMSRVRALETLQSGGANLDAVLGVKSGTGNALRNDQDEQPGDAQDIQETAGPNHPDEDLGIPVSIDEDMYDDG